MYSVSVFKSKIWPDLHLGSEVPIPQFLQSFTCAEVAFLGLGTILFLGGWRLQVAIWGNRKRAQQSSNTTPEPSRPNHTKRGNFKGNGCNKQKELIAISCAHTHRKLLPSITNNAVMIESADVQNSYLEELHTNATVPGWFVASKSTAHVEKQSKWWIRTGKESELWELQNVLME